MSRFDNSIANCEQFLIEETFYPLHMLLFPSFSITMENFTNNYPPIVWESIDSETVAATLEKIMKTVSSGTDNDENSNQYVITVREYSVVLPSKVIQLIDETKSSLTKEDAQTEVCE